MGDSSSAPELGKRTTPDSRHDRTLVQGLVRTRKSSFVARGSARLSPPGGPKGDGYRDVDAGSHKERRQHETHLDAAGSGGCDDLGIEHHRSESDEHAETALD